MKITVHVLFNKYFKTKMLIKTKIHFTQIMIIKNVVGELLNDSNYDQKFSHALRENKDSHEAAKKNYSRGGTELQYKLRYN